jgi:hypothetical protein
VPPPDDLRDRMTDPVLDAALPGTLLALLVLLAAALWRDRPRLPAARASTVMCLGLCAQGVSSTPLFEASPGWRGWPPPLW